MSTYLIRVESPIVDITRNPDILDDLKRNIDSRSGGSRATVVTLVSDEEDV